MTKILKLNLPNSVERFNRQKFEPDKAFKKEIKEWKKELGSERRIKINLEKKLSRILNQTEKAVFFFYSQNQTCHHPLQ